MNASDPNCEAEHRSGHQQEETSTGDLNKTMALKWVSRKIEAIMDFYRYRRFRPKRAPPRKREYMSYRALQFEKEDPTPRLQLGNNSLLFHNNEWTLELPEKKHKTKRRPKTEAEVDMEHQMKALKKQNRALERMVKILEDEMEYLFEELRKLEYQQAAI